MACVNGVTWQQRLTHLGLNSLAFLLCYVLANAWAQQQLTVRNVALAWDAHIPFLPWMVLPYASSGLFFCAAFFLVRSPDALRVLSQRLLLATAVAGAVFALLPLQFGWPRPMVTSPVLATLFQGLELVDRPYNQLPSLHVAYCLLFWASLHPQLTSLWVRMALGGWLVLTAVSTLFTYQHHLLDVAGGLLLGGVCITCVPPGRSEPFVGLYYFVAACIALVLGRYALPLCATLYLVPSLGLVSLAYARRHQGFLHKRQGQFPWWVWCVYAPYLLGYRLTWLAVRWRDRNCAPLRQISPQLWIGRRLTSAEARLLPPNCSIIDLANELPETKALRTQAYQHFALLDIVLPPADTVQQIVAAVRRETDAGRPVYLHCAMGYRRCLQIASACTQ
ncbi:MAG: phosphatase PAP2 family protein [Burkholderiales bacterium]|nr:phosphatase PAP2 family protein [Burkholderiales bacterium]